MIVLALVTGGCTTSNTDPTASASSASAVVASTSVADASTDASSPTPTAPTASASAFASSFVTRSGRQLLLDGRPFRFVGANLYDAAASARYSCNPGKMLSDQQLLTTLTYLHNTAGVTVLRFWAYQTYTQGGTYFAGVDRVIAAAKQAGLKVLPVLEDGPGNCTNMDDVVPKSKYDGDTWYTNGYRVPYGNATLSYRDYVKLVVAHYANEPTIFGWSMMNEAETSARDSSDRSQLVDFATDIAGVIRSVDARHLITVGTQSNGAPGASGPDFSAVYGVPQVDLAEVHDWAIWGSDTEAMPGGVGSAPPAADAGVCTLRNAPIGCSFALAPALDKPLFVGEAGMTGVTQAQRDTRADLLRAKMDAAFGAGAAGYLVWSINTGITDGYDIQISDDDPLIPVLAIVARSLS